MPRGTSRTDVTADFLREVLEYDPETGIFRWRHNSKRAARWNTRHAGLPAGCPAKRVHGRIQIRLPNGALYWAYRLAWLYMTGRWPSDEIDHINGDPSDDRFSNLREVTHQENSCNRGKSCNNTSGFSGVRYREHHRKWEARISVNRKTVWRAYAASAQEAAALRRAALPLFHGRFARHA